MLVTSEKRLGIHEHFILSVYWFAVNLHWVAILNLIMPSQIVQIVPEQQALFLSLILGAGAIVALVLPPIIGAYSDRSTSRWGRRRPYIAIGTLINLVGLYFLWKGGVLLSLWMYSAAFVIIQFGNNVATAAYSGFIPDLVAKEQRGEASGWMGAMTQIGTVVGAFLIGMLMGNGNVTESYLIIAFSMVLLAVVTLVGVKEVPLDSAPKPIEWSSFFKGLWKDSKDHPDFVWLWITRALLTMGMWLMQPYIQYYLRDVVGISHPEQQTGILLGLTLIGATITSLSAGKISDRIGRKIVIYFANTLMAMAVITFLFSHSFLFTLIVAVIYGLGLGAYFSVDWALGCDVLPSQEDAARHMGVWNISMVLPQLIGPPIAGLLLSHYKYTLNDVIHYGLTGYTIIFTLAAGFFVLSAVLIKNIRGAR